MSKFLVVKKQYEANNSNKPKMLISKQTKNITDSNSSRFSIIKKQYNIKVNVEFDSCGGSNADPIEVIFGKTYGELPSPSKTQHVFLGWYTQTSGGTKITSDSIVSIDITKLYAQWELVNIDSSNCTSYEVKTTSSYKNTGIYEASIKSSSTPIYIDWGDGSVEKLTSSISQKSHTYSSAGTFTVKINNNITSFAPSYNNSAWYGTTSQNRYTFNRMISTGSNITSIPSYAFCYCQKMTNIDFMETCFTNVTSLPSYCFYYCSGLTSIQGAARYTSLGAYCFQYCTGLSGVQNLSNFKFTSLTNSYVFANCTNVTEWIFPETFTGTTLGNYTFSNNTKLTNVGQLSSITIVPLNTLTAIPSYGFQNCTSLKNTLITKNVKAINSYAFYGCTALSSIDYQATDLTSIGNYAFYNCTSNRNIQVPDSVKSIGSYAFYYNYNTNASSLNLPNGLTSLGTYAYQNCYNLKNLSIPSSLTSIGDYAFAGCRNLSSISDYRLIAQTVGANTFGNTTGTGTNAYTGYSTRGNNKLSVYVAATGYDENAWDDPLQNPDKCGFVQQYIDPENVVSCTVTFDAGIGSISEASRSIIKGKKIGTLPVPRCPVDTPYFGGWFTNINGTGTKVSKDYRITSDITFYALYSTVPFTVCNIDLNNQWRASSKANPDSSLYDGPYESNSNYNIGNAYSKMYIRISGYSTFNVYIRSYAESSYDYVVAMNLDVDVTSNPSSGTSNVKAHTSGKQNSGTAIGNYTKVEYTDIPDGEHFICIVYRKDGSVNNGDDRGYVLIDKQDVASTDSRSIFLVDDVGILYDEDKQLMIASERI